MVVSERTLKWAMRFYPPLFFQRIWTLKIEPGFTGVDVKICKSWLNTNYNKSIFGGTIFSAADPFYLILFDRLLSERGLNIKLWLKQSRIEYWRPGTKSLYFTVKLNEDDIQEALEALNASGKFIKTFPVKITNKQGAVCAIVYNEVYIEKLTG